MHIIKIHIFLHTYLFNWNYSHWIFLTPSSLVTFISYFPQITVMVLVKKENVKGILLLLIT